jgi:hypothetical protein
MANTPTNTNKQPEKKKDDGQTELSDQALEHVSGGATGAGALGQEQIEGETEL